MRVLFAISTPYTIEPIGVMLLIALCKKAGHQTRLFILKKRGFVREVERFEPDVVAYSAPSANVPLVAEHDAELRQYIEKTGKHIHRIMGGPHATYAPQILDELALDAVCQGDGDRALLEWLRRLTTGEPLDEIPNIGLTGSGAIRRELVTELDELPFPDREEYYRAVPYCRDVGMRSVLTGRGCPYSCSYCYNPVFKEMFSGCGTVLRRRSVENVIEEIEEVRRRYPPLRLIRFSDDTFAHKVDPWLERFCELYPARIGVPFYCLMRPNTLSDDTARLLAQAGCTAIGMSIETGSEQIRREILSRPLTDQVVAQAYATARKYRIATFAGSMVAIPGTTSEDDFRTLEFAKTIGPSVPTFSICTPYKGTPLWQMTVEKGFLDAEDSPTNRFCEHTMLRCFTPQEKEYHARIVCLGTLYCTAPRWLRPLILRLIRSRIPIPMKLLLGKAYMLGLLAVRIFPQGISYSPRTLLHGVFDTIRYGG